MIRIISNDSLVESDENRYPLERNDSKNGDKPTSDDPPKSWGMRRS